jgi:hypothetical protein
MRNKIQYERIAIGLWTATLRDETGRKWSVQGAGKTVQEAESAMWEQYRKTFNT